MVLQVQMAKMGRPERRVPMGAMELMEPQVKMASAGQMAPTALMEHLEKTVSMAFRGATGKMERLGKTESAVLKGLLVEMVLMAATVLTGKMGKDGALPIICAVPVMTTCPRSSAATCAKAHTP